MKTAGNVLGVIWGGSKAYREGGLQPQLITGEFNGILNSGATPSNYLRTKGWGPQVWRTGLGGLREGPGKEVCWGGGALTIPLISAGI